jgi:hypothetical protein
MADSEQKVDDRVEFLRGRVASAFKHLKADRVDKGFNAPESMYVSLLTSKWALCSRFQVVIAFCDFLLPSSRARLYNDSFLVCSEAIMDFLDSKDTRVLVFGESCTGK